jgi:hypothetical protein
VTNQTRRYVERALVDNGVVELRHQLGSRWQTGWFDDADPLLKQAWSFKDAGNLFTSLNRPSPRVVENRMGGKPICNDDIQFITRMFFDFDPVRPTGCPSTNDELMQAWWSSQECRKLNRAMGWPEPVSAISGNGAHLMYRCHLPNTEEIRQQLTAIYTGMRTDYSTDLVDFDRTVRNPGRICALYGTIKRKGVSTSERPHRQSEIKAWPRDWKQVPRRKIEALASFYSLRDQPPAAHPGSHKFPTSGKITGDGDYNTLDVIAWFTAHGLYEHHITDVMHSVKCPWEDEHTEEHLNDTIIFANTDGSWPGFHCKHSHCEGRTIRDVMQVMGDADAFCTSARGKRL